MTELLIEWIVVLGPWRWAVLGIVLLLAEVLLPGVFLFWFGLAGFAVAIQTALIPLPWQAQLAFYILYCGAFIWLARWLDRRRPADETNSGLNKRGEALVGRVVALDTAIENGFGQARVDDTVWRVSGPDRPAGSKVLVTGVEGATLTVKDSAETAKDG